MVFTYTRSDINIVKNYINNKIIPAKIKTNRDIERFHRKYSNITIYDNRLYLNDKLIIFKENINDFLNLFYSDTNLGFCSRDKLYSIQT